MPRKKPKSSPDKRKPAKPAKRPKPRPAAPAGPESGAISPVSEPPVLWPLQAVLLAVFVLIAVASFLPHVQLWGVNHLAFYSLPVRLVALGVMGLAFVPFVARRLYTALLALSRAIKDGGQRTETAIVMIAFLSIILFVGLRSSTNLLGDGQLIAQSFEAAWEGNDKVVMRTVHSIVTEETIAPGATLYYYGAAKIASGVFKQSPVYGIRYFNCLLGVVFLFVFLRLLRRGPFSPELRLWLLVLVLFSSSMELFFGYVENYTPLLFIAFLYVASSLSVLHERGHLWLVIVLFLVSFYTHIQSFLFAPSLIYLILWRVIPKRRAFVEKYVAPAFVFLTVVGAYAVSTHSGFERFYLPLFANEDSYGLLSPTHLLDVFNELLMLMPVLPVFLVMAWISRYERHKTGKTPAALKPSERQNSTGPQPGERAWFTLNCEWQYVLLILIPCVVYLFLFKPEIGMARDWDLFAMTNLAMIPLALLIINRFFRGAKIQSEAAVFTTPAVVITIVLAAAWIGINASPARTTERFERILEYDRTHASYAYENLAIFYYDSGNLEKATEMMTIATDISHNPRQYVRLGMYWDEQERDEEAIELMRDVLRRDPAFSKARFLLVTLLEKNKRFPELLDVAREGTEQHPKEAIYWFYLGEMSIGLGNVEEGVAAFRRCIALNPPPMALARAQEQIEKHATPP